MAKLATKTQHARERPALQGRRGLFTGVLSLVTIAAFGSSLPAYADTNSGLDLTRPLLQAGYSYQNTYFSPGVVGDTRALSLSLPLSFGQFKVALPYSVALHFAPLRTSAIGRGDLTVSYNYILPLRDARFRQTFGVAYETPGDETVGTREQQIAPLYQLSYRLNSATSLLFLAKYAFGYGAAPGQPRYNELDLTPSALLSLRSNTYVALAPEYQHFSGPASNAAYRASVDVGRVFSGLNVMVNYGVPLGAYSYEHLYRSTYGLSASLQL